MDATLIAAAAIVIFGGLVSGVAGFGFALVTGPLLLLLFDPPTVTALCICLTMLTSWMVLVGNWRKGERDTVKAILPGAVVGLVIGVALVQIVAPVWIKLVSAVAVILFTIALAYGRQLPGIGSRFAPPFAGLLSGVMNTTTGIAGPPIAILFTGRQFDPVAFRVSIILYFYVVDTLAIGLLLQQGVIGSAEMGAVLRLLLPASAGLVAGRRLAKRVSPTLFRRVTFVLLFATGGIAAFVALRELLAG